MAERKQSMSLESTLELHDHTIPSSYKRICHKVQGYKRKEIACICRIREINALSANGSQWVRFSTNEISALPADRSQWVRFRSNGINALPANRNQWVRLGEMRLTHSLQMGASERDLGQKTEPSALKIACLYFGHTAVTFRLDYRYLWYPPALHTFNSWTKSHKEGSYEFVGKCNSL